MRVAQQTGRLYNAPDRDVRVVVTEHFRAGRGREAFYSTEVDSTIETILRTYSWRWSVSLAIAYRPPFVAHPRLDSCFTA